MNWRADLLHPALAKYWGWVRDLKGEHGIGINIGGDAHDETMSPIICFFITPPFAASKAHGAIEQEFQAAGRGYAALGREAMMGLL